MQQVPGNKQWLMLHCTFMELLWGRRGQNGMKLRQWNQFIPNNGNIYSEALQDQDEHNSVTNYWAQFRDFLSLSLPPKARPVSHTMKLSWVNSSCLWNSNEQLWWSVDTLWAVRQWMVTQVWKRIVTQCIQMSTVHNPPWWRSINLQPFIYLILRRQWCSSISFFKWSWQNSFGVSVVLTHDSTNLGLSSCCVTIRVNRQNTLLSV